VLRDVFEYKYLPYYNFGILVNECGKNVHMGVNSYQFAWQLRWKPQTQKRRTSSCVNLMPHRDGVSHPQFTYHYEKHNLRGRVGFIGTRDYL
jgi:hypothetical protein